jgi:hypothetical protein
MKLFSMDSVPELNTKNLGNSPNFRTITNMTLYAKQFRSYGIFMMDVTAEFCFWTEERQNGSSHLGLGLAKTLEVLHTISVDNSLNFPMVHKTAQNS